MNSLVPWQPRKIVAQYRWPLLLVKAGLVAAALGCSPAAESPSAGDAAVHESEILAFRQAREQRLRTPDGWLTLVGLHWLREGRNPFGSDPESHVILPEGKAPALAGAFVVEGGRVRVEVAPGVPVTHEGRSVASLELQNDMQGDPTILALGPLQFYVIERSGRLGIRVKDSESEALRSFTGLDYYPIEASWRIEARYEPYDGPRTLEVPNFVGTPTQETSPGALVFEVEGTTYRMDAIPDDPSYVLVFADSTNGSETYGGGRFLRVELPAEVGPAVLDFNKAYNPPCVFTPYATCPLPPPRNKIAAAVRAGEKSYAGH
jgi:uncharacterized protein (DUF1684 family)